MGQFPALYTNHRHAMPEESPNNPNPLHERVGKYEILGHIASGGMGVVYKARDLDLDRIVALKVLSTRYANDPKALTRFRREAKASAQLRHDNIVAIYDVGEADGTHFLALEYIEGTDLQNYIDRKCRLDPAEARYIIIQATRALIHAHEHKIVHRDIKPSNFLMAIKDRKLQVKLTDFGLAIRSEDDAEFRVTRDGTTVGTVDYMSPEQAQNSKAVDIRSDIYSLGCTFYHMLAGAAPFARGTLTERLLDHMQSEPPDIRQLNKGVPESLLAIVHRMLAKKPDDRFQTPTELLEALVRHEKVAPSSHGPAAHANIKAGRKAPNWLAPTVVVENMQLAKETKQQTHEELAPEVLEAAPDVEEPKKVKPPRRKKATMAAGEGKAVKSPHSRKETESTTAETDEDVSIPTRIPVRTRDHRDDLNGEDAAHDEDESEVRNAKKPATKKTPVWIMAVGGTLAALLLVLVMAIVLGRRPPRPKPIEDPPPPPIPIVIPPPPIEPPPVSVPEIDTSPWKMNAGPLPWPIMDPLPAEIQRAALRKEYAGPVLAFPDVPAAARTLHVRRLATTGATLFRTVADALLAKAPPDGWTVIEIHDNGPIFVSALPALARRSIVLRGAPGYRPLLAWEPPKTGVKGEPAAVLLPLEQGRLVLDNLDIVMRWPHEQPAVLFDLRDADFHARDCTFSLIAKSSPGVTVVQQRAAAGETKPERPPQVSVQRCYVRGPDVTLLSADRTTVSLLVEDSLIVGQNQPLLDVRGQEEDAFSLHGIGSTFVTARVMLRWRAATGSGGMPRINGFMLDSIMSRNDPAKTLGDMIHLAGGAEPGRMAWKSTNCVYAGWEKLLACKSDIIGEDLASWRQRWGHTQGDRALKEPWPGNLLSRLEERAADTFMPPDELAYAAWTSAGAVGCAIGRLPAEPPVWLERAYDPPPTPNFPIGEADITPAINPANDGWYHGEQIDLNKTPDLGAYFSEVLKKVKPAPRIVLHLSGKGSKLTSSLRVKGVQHLIVYFVPTKDPKDALKLEIHPAHIAQKAPLVEMAGGHLELIGARLELSAGTFIPTMIQVQGGDLTLTRCWLQGPVSKLPDGFKTLLSVSNPSAPAASVVMRNCVLLSNRLLLQLQDNVQLKARGSLFLSLGDGVYFDGTAPTAVPLVHLLDHNTWAIRQTTFTLRSTPDHLRSAPIALHAGSNAFLNPFADDTDKTTFLRGFEALASRGLWNWQGRFNVHDARLNTYFSSIEKGPGPRQSLKDWQQAWASVGEQGAMLFEPKLPVKTIPLDTISPAALLSQLDRLVLPPQLRGDPEQAPPGVNLVGMGLVKKKG